MDDRAARDSRWSSGTGRALQEGSPNMANIRCGVVDRSVDTLDVRDSPCGCAWTLMSLVLATGRTYGRVTGVT